MSLRPLIIKLVNKFGFSGFVLLIFFTISLFVLLNNPVRQQLRKYFSPVDRKILSVAVGRVTPNGSSRVIKVQTLQGTQLEVYGEADSTNHEPLIDTIFFADTHDAYIQFQGQATNLALKDMNGDQIYEIISPVYSKSLVPRLHILTYNVQSKKFETYGE